jgi:hypothetical protein
MAAKLASYYDQAGNLGGLPAKMKLALLTRMPSSKAAEAPDSQDNIALFETALRQVKQEFGG